MKTNQLLMLAGVGILGFAAYKYFTTPAAPAGWQGANYVPPGGSWNGITNNTGQPTWVNILNGVLTGVNAAGQIIAQIPWNQITNQPVTQQESEVFDWISEG